MTCVSNTPIPAGVPHIEPRHRMRIALEHAHVSMGEMAELLEVSGNTVGNYLAGRSVPSAATLRVWAMRCGVPLDWIRYGTENDDDGGPGLGVPPTAWSDDRPGQVVHLRKVA